MFYAPWCGHCKKLMPKWEELANLHSGNSMNVGRIDCDEEQDLCSAFEIQAYPRLLYLSDQKYYRYKGERGLEALENFVFSGAFEKADEQKPIPFHIKRTENKKSRGFLTNVLLLVDQIFI